MINKFITWYEGCFSNKKQSMSEPTKFASIVLQHTHLENGYFYGEQSYLYTDKDTYRQFISRAVEINSKIHLQNYVLHNKELYLGNKNLSQINTQELSLRQNCDIIFEYRLDTNFFHGSTTGKNCTIEKNNSITCISTKAILGEYKYDIEDRGFDTKTSKQVWGSSGMYNFERY